MKETGKHILTTLKNRWRARLYLEVVLFALGPAVLIFGVFASLMAGLGALVVGIVLSAGYVKPWKLDEQAVSGRIDSTLEFAEFSSGLLLKSEGSLSAIAKLQQHRVYERLTKAGKQIKPKDHLWLSLIWAALLTGTALMLGSSLATQGKPIKNTTESTTIHFEQSDTLQKPQPKPVLVSRELEIRYPQYTGVGLQKSASIDVKVLENSSLTWKLQFDIAVDSLELHSGDEVIAFQQKENTYSLTTKAQNSFLYNFTYKDAFGRSYASDLHSVEVVKDKEPLLEIKGIPQFTSFNFSDDKKLNFKAIVADDYGLADVHIIATVSKGTGESVKFREEKLPFVGYTPSGKKNLELSKMIDLVTMKMDPGDELYFYVEAFDYRQPQPNVARSETFFAAIKDTTSYEFGVEGTLGVDLMPDYFRSQRQLIIDTEKLLRDKPQMAKKDFNFTSNELGFDQKALRLKYGEFMGDEAESGIAVTQPSPEEEAAQDEKDPLARYTHDHDGANEHNLVEHEDDNDKEKKEDPLEAYLHNHDDPEESTLFTQSLRGKLREAMNEMWDAELYLRLFKPEESLPYQYRALKLIQEIKNSARIYVHRIGFDPPPIKEDKRLSGKLDGVKSFKKDENLKQEEVYPNIRKAIILLETLKTSNHPLKAAEKEVLEKAGNELGGKAIEEPGKYLKTLQDLKWLIEGREIPGISSLQQGLMAALPDPEPNPEVMNHFGNELDGLFLKALENRDE